MLEFIESMPDRTKPAATLRALVNQDHESLHRKIKMNWANRNGQTVFSNQHDGIGVGLDAEHDTNTVAKALSAEITATCGYDVKVDAKPMDHKRPQVKPYVWPVQKIGSTKGSPYVVVTPTNFENTIRASFEDVWHERVSSASTSQEVVMLSDHDTPSEALLAHAPRACSFEIQESEQQKAWDSPLMREMRMIAERGQVWVGRPKDRRGMERTDLDDDEQHQPVGMSAETNSDGSASPSMASEDLGNGYQALDSTAASSEYGSPDDTETMSDGMSTSEASSVCSTPCIEPCGSGPLRTMQGGAMIMERS